MANRPPHDYRSFHQMPTQDSLFQRVSDGADYPGQAFFIEHPSSLCLVAAQIEKKLQTWFYCDRSRPVGFFSLHNGSSQERVRKLVQELSEEMNQALKSIPLKS